MPVVKINKRYFNSLLKLRMSDEQLKDQISKLGLEIESMSKDEIEIELSPSRPDLLDPVGIARALRYFMHKSDKFHYTLDNKKPEMTITVSSSVKNVRPFIAGMVVKGIKLDETSLQQLMSFTDKFCDTFGRKRKKIAIGIHNLDSIESMDLSYTLAKDEKFTALNSEGHESFSSILKTNKKGIGYGEVIEYGKSGYPVLRDSKGVLALIPIINSERTKVTKSTKNLFVDVTGNSEYAIGKSIDMLAAMFMDIGAAVYPVVTSYGSSRKIYPVMESGYISIALEDIWKSLGVRFDYRAAISLANKMGYEAASVGKRIRFSLPEYRIDIMNEQDIIEDMAIAYGYDYIQPIGLPSYNAGLLESTTLKNRNLESIMTGMGFTQVMNSYLTNPSANYEKMEVMKARDEAVTIANSVNSSISMLRTWLLPSLMGNLSKSQHEKMPQRLFELDMAFSVNASKKATEEYRIAAVVSDPKANLNDIKAVLEELMYMNRVKYTVSKCSHGSFIEGRCGEIKADGKSVGFFGEIHPKVLNNFSIDEPVSAFEINIQNLGIY
jgi:phenylalanyl-tRNA synthetase beta chain